MGIGRIGVVVELGREIGGIDRMLEVGGDLEILERFVEIWVVVGYGIEVKEREIGDMNMERLVGWVEIIKRGMKVGVIIIKLG